MLFKDEIFQSIEMIVNQYLEYLTILLSPVVREQISLL